MNLYRRSIFLASLALLAVSSIAILAQRRATHKLRATALLEITTDSFGVVKSSVIPIAILDEGHFHDASIYKATPRPMALADGVVYEAQKDGKAVGYVTITTGANQGGWIALGKWSLPTAAKKPETQQPAAPTDQRPILHHGDSAPAASATPTPEQPSAGSAPPPQDPDRPVLRKAPEKAQPEQSAVATPTPGAAASTPAAPPVEPGTKVFVGVSDADASETRSYNYPWKPGEEQQMQNRMIKIALGELPHENSQLTPNSLKNVVMRSFDLDMSNEAVLVLSAEVPGSYLAPAPKQPPAAKQAPRAKRVPDTKQAPDTKQVPDTTQAPGKFVSRYVTVIARVNFEGVPRKLASSVTDSTRLDVAPRLELIDAVDVDGDGLAELLFREYSFDEKSFIIYCVGRNAVTKVFEGASSKLK